MNYNYKKYAQYTSGTMEDYLEVKYKCRKYGEKEEVYTKYTTTVYYSYENFLYVIKIDRYNNFEYKLYKEV